MMSRDRYDVVILGAGIAGTILAAILARHGRSVLVIEESEHPKFAIGEATIPEFTLRMRLAALRFDVPELSALTNFYSIRDQLGSNHGVKRAFSFVYHRAGQAQDPRESVQMPTLAPPIGPDAHLFRQDVDAHYLAVAIRYGATILQRAKPTRFAFDAQEVCVETEKHGSFRAKYLVDAGGMRSPLADALQLRESPTRYQTRSRAIYSHFVGVRPYDEIIGSRKAHRCSYPLWQSTLHHLFDGGWMWMIPFHNHPRATNPLCSVGLLLDLQRFPEQAGTPEEVLYSVIERFPSVARQFERARPVRAFVGSGRLQYSSRRVVGERWCLTSHAGAFIDPLYSSGLMITIGTITLLADTLLKAFEDGDFATERFAAIEEFVQSSFAQFDRVVAASYVSFRDFSLYNAWFRLYATSVLFGTLSPIRCYFKYLETGDKAALAAIDQLPYRAVAGSGWPETQHIFQRCFAQVMAVRDQGACERQAAQRVFEILREVDFVFPSFHLANPDRRSPGPFTLPHLLQDLMWARRRSPTWMRRDLCDWPLRTAVWYGAKALVPQVGRALSRAPDPLRDTFFSWRPNG